MRSLIFIFILLFLQNAMAGGTAGNGGSGDESKIVAAQAQVETVASKLRLFFLKNETLLKVYFPEVDIPKILKLIKSSDLRIVETNDLVDKNGLSRTCLNYPDSQLIECRLDSIESLVDQPAVLFVLIFHEFLGLAGVEETSPKNSSFIDGYSISKRIAPFVTKVNNYDLVMEAPCDVISSAKKLALYIVNDNAQYFNLSNKKTVFSEEELFDTGLFWSRSDLLETISRSKKWNQFISELPANASASFVAMTMHDLKLNLKDENLEISLCK
ncbi:MAG: hypothetical protein AB7I27_11685 [Bacteriovoracaceae bacterium]